MRLWKKPWSTLSAKSAKTGGRLKDLPNPMLDVRRKLTLSPLAVWLLNS
jgi:hypothetical protein